MGMTSEEIQAASGSKLPSPEIHLRSDDEKSLNIFKDQPVL